MALGDGAAENCGMSTSGADQGDPSVQQGDPGMPPPWPVSELGLDARFPAGVWPGPSQDVGPSSTAEAIEGIRSAAAAGRISSFIHEFQHPAVVVHFHSEDVPSLGQVRTALDQGVHAVELDLHFVADAAGGGDIFCGHDAGDITPNSPRLRDMVNLILRRKGERSTVQGDDRQFFLILEPKDLDTRLFAALFDYLDTLRPYLSTAVARNDPPRPITVVITGTYPIACYGWLLFNRGVAVHQLFVSENIDYTGVIEDLSGFRPPSSFNWTALAYSNDALAGRVNTLHLGRDLSLPGRFNVRVWDTNDDDELKTGLSAGFDSVNCNADKVERFMQILANQQPRGHAPWLTARGNQALLAWRGNDSDNLYVSLGTLGPDGLSFPRQLCLTNFLQGRPQGKAPSVVALPDGRVLLVYEGTDSQRLWYVSGLFQRFDRYVSFDGSQFKLSLPDDTGWRGTMPGAAMAPGGRILVAYQGTNHQRLWYISGFLNPSGRLIGTEYQLTQGEARRGSSPTVAFGPNGRVVVVYEGTSHQRLWYVSGTLDATGRIVGDEHQLTQGDARRGSNPFIAFAPDGRVIVIYEGTTDERIFYVSGHLQGGEIVSEEFPLTQGQSRRGHRPTIAFGSQGDMAVLYEGTDQGKLWYVFGRLDGDGRIQGQEQLLDLHLDPAS
jgi:hypothetical protein